MKEEILKLVKAAAEGNQEAQQQIEQIMQAAQQPGADSKLVQIAQYIMQLLQPESAKKGCKTKKKPLIPTKKCGKKVEKGSLGISSKPCKCMLKKVGGTIIEVDSCTGLPYMKKGKVLKAKVRKGNTGFDSADFMKTQDQLSAKINAMSNQSQTNASTATTAQQTGNTPGTSSGTGVTSSNQSIPAQNIRHAAPSTGVGQKSDIAEKLGPNMTNTMQNLLGGVSNDFDFRRHWMGTPVSTGSSLSSINNAQSGINKAFSLMQKSPTQQSATANQLGGQEESDGSQVTPENVSTPPTGSEGNTNTADPTAQIADRNARKLARQNARHERRMNRMQNKQALNKAKFDMKQEQMANKQTLNEQKFNMNQAKVANNQTLRQARHDNRMVNIANSAEANAARRDNIQAGLNDWREHSQSAMTDRRENRQAAQLDRLKHKKEINDFKSTM